MSLIYFKAQVGRSHMFLTRRKKREEMLRDENIVMSKKYEDEKEEFIEKIKNLNQQLFDLNEVRRENDDLNLKMSILLEKGAIDEEGNYA